jgi:flap endonuclease-1
LLSLRYKRFDVVDFLFKVLEGFDMSMDQFVDLCILLGCDYCDKIRGVGPKSAFKMVQDHKTIEEILKRLDKKHSAPDNWMFEGARRLFKDPEVTPAKDVDLKWEKPDEEGLVKYMCEEKGFAEDRIRNGAKKLLKGREGVTQGRLDSFFKVLPSTPNSAVKRKSEEVKGSAKKAKGGAGGGGGGKNKGYRR